MPTFAQVKKAIWRSLNIEHPELQRHVPQTVVGAVVDAYLTTSGAGSKLQELLDRNRSAACEFDALERVVLAVRRFDLRYGRNVSRLFDLIGSASKCIPSEFDPSSTRLSGADLQALEQIACLTTQCAVVCI
jgi:hypothetical protein